GLLLDGDAQGFAIQFLGRLGISLPQQQLPFVPVQLRFVPACPRPLYDLQCIFQQGRRFFSLPRDFVRPRQKGALIGRPRLGPCGAVAGRTAAQKRYPISHITILYLDPSPIDRSLRTPEGESLLTGDRTHPLYYPLAEDCVVSGEREQRGAERQA